MRYFTCNSPSYTDEHNDYMDILLWGLAVSTYPRIGYDETLNAYYPLTEKGLMLLEHLQNLDLIQEVFENDF